MALPERHALRREKSVAMVVETCKRLGIPVRAYLADVLPGLADRNAAHLAAPTPMARKFHRPD